MIFRQYLHDERSCASYLIGCPSMGVAVIIDPQGDLSTYGSDARQHGLRITEVIETHVHADHVSGARELAVGTGATLRLGPDSEVDFGYQTMTDGELIEVGNRRIRVLHTPGHTPEHVCLSVDDWFVLTGDTLFVGDVGRIDLALGEIDQDELRARAGRLHESLRRLVELPSETEIYPGHYAGSTCGRGMDGKTISTIGREKRTNPALQLDLDDFIRFQLTNVPPMPADFKAIKRTNVGAATGASLDRKEVVGKEI